MEAELDNLIRLAQCYSNSYNEIDGCCCRQKPCVSVVENEYFAKQLQEKRKEFLDKYSKG